MGFIQELAAGPPFQPGTWWIDERGREHQGVPLRPLVEKWFLRQLGQVKLRLAPVLVEITWDTARVETEALETVRSYLSEMDPNVSVRLSFFYHGWGHEIFRDTFSATERIDEIQDCKSVAVLHETRVSDCPISDIRYASPRLKQGYQSWQRTAGRLDRLDQSEYARFLPNVLMFRPDQREENLVFSWVGMKSTAARVYGADWVKKSPGRISNCSFGVESQSHADKVSAGMAETLLTGEPLYQHFRALMRIEDQEPFWVPYERLLTRYVSRGGAPIVISDAYPTQYVDVSLAGSP